MAKGKGPAVRCELRVFLPSGRFFLFACLFLFADLWIVFGIICRFFIVYVLMQRHKA